MRDFSFYPFYEKDGILHPLLFDEDKNPKEILYKTSGFVESQPTRHWSTEHEGAHQGGQMNGNQFGWVATGHRKEISEPDVIQDIAPVHASLMHESRIIFKQATPKLKPVRWSWQLCITIAKRRGDRSVVTEQGRNCYSGGLLRQASG